mmetsp:Transcript_5983/g.19164  ORF Transcript_5983/g.19164 Transcript_5983/m.19164 type:complete len:261 (-) Transcript_5983:1098-1880(-)
MAPAPAVGREPPPAARGASPACAPEPSRAGEDRVHVMLVWNHLSPARVSRSLAARGCAEPPGGVPGVQALPLLVDIAWGPLAEVIWDHAMCRVPGRPSCRGPLLARGLPSLKVSEGCPVTPPTAACRPPGSRTSRSPCPEASSPARCSAGGPDTPDDMLAAPEDTCGSMARRCGLPRMGEPGVAHPSPPSLSGLGQLASNTPWVRRPPWRLTGGSLLEVLRSPRTAWGLLGWTIGGHGAPPPASSPAGLVGDEGLLAWTS